MAESNNNVTDLTAATSAGDDILQSVPARPSSASTPPTPSLHLHVKDLAKPLGWYVDWVRSNPEGASSLTRFSRTFAMLVSEPSDLVQMELCWGAAKMHASVNEAILYTANRRVTASEGITLFLSATQEVECLLELLVRKYKGSAAAWNAMLGLEAIKGILNACVHRQLFLVPWIWQSVRLFMKRAVRRVYRAVVHKRPRRIDDGQPGRRRELVGGGSNVVGETAGPGGVRLVIPRVVSDRRSIHPHTYYLEENEDATMTARTRLAKDDDEDDDDDRAKREDLESVHFTWVDVVGMCLDVYLLVRPVALVWAARRSFPRGPDAESIGKPPVLPSAKVWAEKQDKINKEAAKAAEAQGLPAPKPAKPQPMPSVMDHVMQSTPARSLCANWRVWGFFAVTDFVVALLARFIRTHRVPVVYIDAQSADEGSNSNTDDAAAAIGAAGRPTLPLPTPPAHRGLAEDDNAEEETTTTVGGPRTERTEVPPVVSRDSLRLQQATRNAAYNFLRDPFFSASLRQFIYNHFVDGFLNRIPLLGAILGYQVSYYLSMQHYSFLYTVGQ